MMKALDAIRPGEILLKEFMEPNSISPQQIAISLGWPINRMTDLVQGSQPITEDIALGLGLFFKIDAQFWRNLQIDYDRRVHASSAVKRR
jgi:addiction module HigA family antidote